MRKIKIIVLLIVLTFIGIKRVKAESFYEDNYVEGVYANLVDGEFAKPQQIRFIRRRSDNKAAYCLTPRAFLYSSENYTRNYIYNQNVISESQLKKINKIAYFGYGYPSHTEDYWYAVTQMMIWMEVEPNMDIFFTDTENGNRITRFVNEMQEINNLINEYEKIPNLTPDNLLADSEYEITDTNSVLNNYQLYYDSGIEVVKKSNNKLKIKTHNKGMYKITLSKEDKLYNEEPYLYTASRGQDIFIQGRIGGRSLQKYFKVLNNKIRVIKTDQNNIPLEGAIYNVYNNKDEYVGEIITDKNGIGEIDHLYDKTHYIKEIKAPEGYIIDDEPHYVYFSSDTETIELTNKKIEANLYIKKYLKNENTKYEEGIIFNIYDMNDNLVTTLTTDKNGFTNTVLEYGKYKMVQLNTTLGYKKVKDFYIDVKDTNTIIYYLEDEIVNSKLIINKLDMESFNLIDNTTFRIKDLNKNIYFDNLYQTHNGTIELDIKGGKYLLEEVTPPINYKKGDSYEFVIDEQLDNKTLTIDFLNARKKGKIKILKLGKLNNNSMLYLENIIFDIYDINDNLVDTVTTDKIGVALSKELDLGKYYIVERNTLPNFKLDNTKYEIELIDNLEDDLIIKDIIIVNNEKNISNDNKTNFKENISNYKKTNYEEENNIKTIYPKTSDKDMYIYIIIGYLAFIGLLYIIASIKNEK